MTNTDSIKVFLTMGFAMAKVVDDLGDGFQLGDLGDILAAAKAVPGGLAQAPTALAQYLAMTDEDAAPLEAWVESNFKIKNQQVETAIEMALKFAIELHGLASFLKPKA